MYGTDICTLVTSRTIGIYIDVDILAFVMGLQPGGALRGSSDANSEFKRVSRRTVANNAPSYHVRIRLMRSTVDVDRCFAVMWFAAVVLLRILAQHKRFCNGWSVFLSCLHEHRVTQPACCRPSTTQ